MVEKNEGSLIESTKSLASAINKLADSINNLAQSNAQVEDIVDLDNPQTM